MKCHNFYGHIQRVVAPATPNVAFAVTHEMGIVPRGYIIARRTDPLASLSRSVTSPGLNAGSNFIAGWEFENSGALGADSGSNNLPLTNNGATQIAGKVGNASHYVRASSQYMTRASESLLSPGDTSYTIAVWVRLTSKPAGVNQEIVTKLGDGVGGLIEYDVRYTNGGGVDRYTWLVGKPAGAVASINATSFGSPPTGAWHFLLCEHNAVADTISIQVNDGAIDSVATGGSLQAGGTSAFMFGRRDYAATPNYLDGDMDQVMFWNRVLTSTERAGLYNSGSGVTVANMLDPIATSYFPVWDTTYAYFQCSQGNAEFYVLFFA